MSEADARVLGFEALTLATQTLSTVASSTGDKELANRVVELALLATAKWREILEAK